LLSAAAWQSDRIVAPMEPGYAAFAGAFGGWTAAGAVLAAQHIAAPEFQPLSLSIEFLKGIGPGEVAWLPQEIRRTRSVQYLRVQTRQADADVATASLVFALRRHTDRIANVAAPRCAVPEALPRLALERVPVTWPERFDLRLAEGQLLQASTAMRSCQWTRFLDAQPLSHARLAALADATFPRIFFHYEQVARISTVTMSVHFHALTSEIERSGKDFVMLEAGSQAAQHGFFDQWVRIWSRAGELLATSTQLVWFDVPAKAGE
jgi:acyl-CoA thioesterase